MFGDGDCVTVQDTTTGLVTELGNLALASNIKSFYQGFSSLGLLVIL